MKEVYTLVDRRGWLVLLWPAPGSWTLGWDRRHARLDLGPLTVWWR